MQIKEGHFVKDTIIHLCLAIVLSWSYITALGEDQGTRADLSTASIYRHAKYGFQFTVPTGWMVRETNFYFAHYSRVFLTVNNQRSDLAIQDQPTGPNTREFNAETTLKQMRPGEVYVSFSHDDSFDGMRADSVESNLDSILSTNRIIKSSQTGLSSLGLFFFKRGHWWTISINMRDPVTEENRSKVMGLLKSFRFADAPVGEASWAGSLAWKELPDNIRNFESQYGWPVVGGRTGQRSVVVCEKNSGYSVKFIQEGVGEWEYSVSPDGIVQAEPPLVYAISPAPLSIAIPNCRVKAKAWSMPFGSRRMSTYPKCLGNPS